VATVVPIQPPSSATEGLEQELARLVRDRVARSDQPLHLAGLGKELRADLGDVVDQTRWFGYRTLGRAIHDLVPELRVQEHFVSDPTRHRPPGPATRTTRPPRP
jgi:hypothetical protein